MSDTPRHSVSVAAAIFDDARENVLLIKRRDNGRWEPPGGVLELDETIEQGLRREVREETGAEIGDIRLSGVYKNMTAGIVALVFSARAATRPEIQSAEAQSVRWIPLDEVDGLMTPAYAVRVRDAMGAGETPPAVRAHDGRLILGPPN